MIVIRAAGKIGLLTADQVALARKAVHDLATELRFGVLERTKFVTAASEIARNTVVHGLGGDMTMQVLEKDGRMGLKLVFVDYGPGIPDIQQALTDGFSTAKSMGLGLGGAKRLVSEFDIQSTPSAGTCVSMTQWKRS